MSNTRLKGNINRIIIEGTLIQHKSRIMREPIKGIVSKVRVNPQWVEERDIMLGVGYDILSGYIPMYPDDD